MKKIFIFIALFPLVRLAGADDMPTVQPLTLKTVVETALQNNPEILAARKKWQAAQARITEERTPDKPRVDLERMYAPRDKNILSGASEKNIAITQEIPFPTSLVLRGRVAGSETEMARAAYDAKVRDVLSRVKKAYRSLAMSHHHIRIVEENTDLMRRFSRVAESKYAVGRASQAEVLKAQVELARMLNMLVDLSQEKETNQAMLNMLLNQSPQTPLGIPAELHPANLGYTIGDLQKMALEQRPELRESELAIRKSRQSLNLARSDYLPDLMFQYRRRNMEAGPDSQDAILGFSVPLWFWKQNAAVREAQADKEMAEAEYAAMRNETLFQVQSRLTKFQTSVRLVQLYDTSVLPQARQALKVTESAYQADKASFLDLIDAARTLLTFEQEYYHSLNDSESNLADLEQLVGMDLQSAALDKETQP